MECQKPGRDIAFGHSVYCTSVVGSKELSTEVEAVWQNAGSLFPRLALSVEEVKNAEKRPFTISAMTWG